MSKVWLNLHQISGHLGHGAELRYTSNQTPVMTFDVAVTKPANTQAEGRPEETTWFKCVLWGKLAETLKPKMLKGTQVFFSGEGSQREWTDRDGNKRKGYEISNWNRWAHQVIIVQPGRPADAPGSPGQNGLGNVSQQPPPQAQGKNGLSQGNLAPGSNEEHDPDLPF